MRTNCQIWSSISVLIEHYACSVAAMDRTNKGCLNVIEQVDKNVDVVRDDITHNVVGVVNHSVRIRAAVVEMISGETAIRCVANVFFIVDEIYEVGHDGGHRSCVVQDAYHLLHRQRFGTIHVWLCTSAKSVRQ